MEILSVITLGVIDGLRASPMVGPDVFLSDV